ncbi:MAG: hypothetical protein J7K34_03170 [Flavobacteriaceae bacterium]|nr:hypothetical protein [Flavobacteriaceae bacterium]
MRKVLLVLLLFSFLTNVNAQKQSKQAKKAIGQTDYVASRMKLNDSKKLFLHNVLLEKFESISEQIKGKDLSKEEKKSIRKKTNTVMNQKLKAEFSKDEIKQIKDLLKEHDKSKKK